MEIETGPRNTTRPSSIRCCLHFFLLRLAAWGGVQGASGGLALESEAGGSSIARVFNSATLHNSYRRLEVHVFNQGHPLKNVSVTVLDLLSARGQLTYILQSVFPLDQQMSRGVI